MAKLLLFFKKTKYIPLLFLSILLLSYPIYYLVGSADTPPKNPVQHYVPDFDHVIIILEENDSSKRIIGNPEATYITSLVKQYSYASQYYATDRPSLPNYIRMTSGTNAGITDNCNPPSSTCKADVENIADRIEESGRTWKAYFEDMPKPCATEFEGLYDNEHNPFIYYTNILNNPKRCNDHVVPFTQLGADLESGNLPNYVYIVPNLCNDMHNCGIKTADIWLSSTVTKIMDSPAFHDSLSAIFITWDESKPPDTNNVPMIITGPTVKKNYVSTNRYDHVSLLKTIETAWNLKPLTNADKSASAMGEFFEVNTGN